MKFKLFFGVSVLLLSSTLFSQNPQQADISKTLKPLTAALPVSGTIYKIRNNASGRYLQPLNASVEMEQPFT